MTRAQVEARYPGDVEATYVFCSGRVCWDARSTQSGLGRYAIDGAHSGLPVNARLTANRHRTAAFIELTRRVRRGQEILVNYGGEFWGGGAKGG